MLPDIWFQAEDRENKVRENAVQPIVGFEHAPKKLTCWIFPRWDLVDFAHFNVRLETEFQDSNRDICRADAILATSKP